MKIFGYFSKIYANSFNSFKEYPAPVGFDGELSINHFVFFEIACSSFSGVSLKLSEIFVWIIFGLPFANITIAG